MIIKTSANNMLNAPSSCEHDKHIIPFECRDVHVGRVTLVTPGSLLQCASVRYGQTMVKWCVVNDCTATRYQWLLSYDCAANST
jgi:hypothetical protein